MSIKLKGYSKKIAGDTETPITLYKKFVVVGTKRQPISYFISI